MNAKIENKLGKIEFSENALQQMVGYMVTEESYGIVGMSNKGDLWEIFKPNSVSKGVDVAVTDENKIKVNLQVIAKYGVSLKTVADNVIENVKFTLEDLTGLAVDSVNVIIENIRV